MFYQTLFVSKNPLVILKGPLPKSFNDLASLVSALLPYIFIIAGLILFVIIISAGFSMMTNPGNPDATKKAQSQLTLGIVGFIIIFASYWLAQLLGSIFGLSLLGS
jgi:type IV secretion system pilin